MYQQFNRYKILRVFFDEPNTKFHLRELVRITTISLPSVKKHITHLHKQGLIREVTDGLYTRYAASKNTTYRMLKRNDLLLRLEESGLITAIETTFTPNCIVLYGSAVEGMDDERGDVDIYVQSTKKEIALRKYETLLKRKINLLCEPSIEKIPRNLKNSLANGIILRGYLSVI